MPNWQDKSIAALIVRLMEEALNKGIAGLARAALRR
jgi:hypothetical protein